MVGAISWVAGYVLVLFISIPINGLLISAAWGWFVAPITGSRDITIAQGVGLSIFISIVGTVATAHLKKWDFGEDTSDWQKVALKGLATMIGVGVISPAITLSLAWGFYTLFLAPPLN